MLDKKPTEKKSEDRGGHRVALSRSEINRIHELARMGATIKEMQVAIGRSDGCIRAKLHEFRINVKPGLRDEESITNAMKMSDRVTEAISGTTPNPNAVLPKTHTNGTLDYIGKEIFEDIEGVGKLAVEVESMVYQMMEIADKLSTIKRHAYAKSMLRDERL